MIKALFKKTLINKPISVLGLGAIISLVGCAPPQPTQLETEPTKPARTYTVDLPKPIDLEALIPPLKREDGTFRIDGLLMQSMKYFETEVTIKGYIVEKSKCPKKSKTCPKPHFWIAETLDQGVDRLRVVDLDRKKLRRLKEKRRYQITGTFSQSSKDNGFINSNGLIIYKSSERISN